MNYNLRRILSYFILVLSIIFVFFGITRGEVGIVFNKAIHICLECIGLG